MELSVCICTHDRPRYVRDCLKGLRAQTVDPSRFEILLVDSGSPSASRMELARLASSLPNIRLIRLAQPGVSVARNAGAAAAAAPYIAFIDDDAIPTPNWVEEILRVTETSLLPPVVLGGTTLRDFTNTEGKPGYFQQEITKALKERKEKQALT